ncbi:MAG: hypothetical protein ACTSR3_12300 [Candidatus Helarchaeota archaeon]
MEFIEYFSNTSKINLSIRGKMLLCTLLIVSPVTIGISWYFLQKTLLQSWSNLDIGSD